jgi:tetratricopeptide (TPR) repeat protein
MLCYEESIKNGDFSELRAWFHALSEAGYLESTELLVAKGAYLSSIGNFIAANDCLDRAIPNLRAGENALYLEAMVHKARVLRNCESFDASNRLLDTLIAERANLSGECAYFIMIEKIYNLAWDSRLSEAFAIAEQAMNTCAQAGDERVRHWYQRYLSVLYYLAGRMKDSVYYYEKSQAIPADELRLLCRHSTEIYVAKAYQMLGRREEAVSMIAKELQRLKSAGLYEELWLGYLFAAEIHYQNISIDNFNGAGKTFETVVKYFTLADEYASMFRKTDTQREWAKMQRRVYSLMFPSEPVEQAIREIFANLDRVSDHFKTVALGRLYHYFGTIGDVRRAAECARMSIEIGERAGMMMIATMAYGILARFSIDGGTAALTKSIELTRHFLSLCEQNGIYEYFRMRKAYDPVLMFAHEQKIEPEITARLMAFCGCQPEKVVVQTLGGFSIYSVADGSQPVKMRTRKERELFAYLLHAGERGATKEQIGQALWYDSETEDVKRLIGVNLAQLKRDLSLFGINEMIQNVNKHYRVARDGIRVDVDEFEEAARAFRETGSCDAAHKIALLYKGEYLAEFEAFWAVGKRLELDAVYRDALRCLNLGAGK